jgi:hypothetical protein
MGGNRAPNLGKKESPSVVRPHKGWKEHREPETLVKTRTKVYI